MGKSIADIKKELSFLDEKTYYSLLKNIKVMKEAVF